MGAWRVGIRRYCMWGVHRAGRAVGRRASDKGGEGGQVLALLRSGLGATVYLQL